MKQVIVMRKDLNMRKGKMIAQACHACLKATLEHQNDPRVQEWLAGIFTKICTSVDSEQELIDIYAKAQEAGLIVSLIIDSGLTEFNGIPTKTCIAIGPDAPQKIDLITGHLKLL